MVVYDGMVLSYGIVYGRRGTVRGTVHGTTHGTVGTVGTVGGRAGWEKVYRCA